MKYITCYNQDLQRFNYGLTKEDFSRDQKNEWLEELKEIVHKAGKSFYKVFPNKKRQVVDHIYYLLTASGINTIHTRTLMKKFDIKSRTTVIEAVKEIRESGQVLVCRLANGHAGTYVFVLKDHPNFNKIMEEVFFIEVLENESNEQQSEQQNEHLQNAETVGTVEVEGDKSDSINLISFSLKQELNYTNSLDNTKSYNREIQDTIENESLAIKDLKQEMEYINTYATNEYQLKTYHYIKAENLHDEIKNHAVILGLRVGSNCNYRSFTVAKAVIKTLDRWIENGREITDSIPAWFSSRYAKDLQELKQSEQRQQQQPEQSKKPLPFYNWLES